MFEQNPINMLPIILLMRMVHLIETKLFVWIGLAT